MSVKRSPPSSRRGSLPDLPSTMDEVADQPITLRKRKQPDTSCCCQQQLSDFRKDITAILDNFVSKQEGTLKFMRENISDIKSQVNDIKISIDSLNNEQIIIKSQITSLADKNNVTEEKIQALEDKITQLSQKACKNTANEDIIQELHERSIREKNIILVGIPESKAKSSNEDHLSDLSEVTKIISNAVKNCPEPRKIFRIGKYNPKKERSIKVCFETTETAKLLLRNKEKFPSNIKIFSDQTPAQQNYLKGLKEELQQRTTRGEKDITIKYLKGVPKIVSMAKPKN